MIKNKSYKYYAQITLILNIVSGVVDVKAEQLPLDIQQPYQVKEEKQEPEKDKDTDTKSTECVIKTVMTNEEIELCSSNKT
jgi:hypothetical protein